MDGAHIYRLPSSMVLWSPRESAIFARRIAVTNYIHRHTERPRYKQTLNWSHFHQTVGLYEVDCNAKCECFVCLC